MVVDLRDDEEKQLQNNLNAAVEEVKPITQPKRVRKPKAVKEDMPAEEVKEDNPAKIKIDDMLDNDDELQREVKLFRTYAKT